MGYRDNANPSVTPEEATELLEAEVVRLLREYYSLVDSRRSPYHLRSGLVVGVTHNMPYLTMDGREHRLTLTEMIECVKHLPSLIEEERELQAQEEALAVATVIELGLV